MKKILFVVGSLRKDSFQGGVAKKVEEIIGDRAEVKVLNYENVPFYNQDLEAEGVPAVDAVRQEVLEADGLWIFSPEYNGKMPGVLKNLLDWLSRALDLSDTRGVSAVNEKKVTFTGAAWSPKAAGVRKELSELLPFMRMQVVGAEGTGLTLTGGDWTEEQVAELEAQVNEFLSAL